MQEWLASVHPHNSSIQAQHVWTTSRHNLPQVFDEMASIMDTTWPFLLTKIIILIFPILYETVTIQIFKYTCVLVYINFGKWYTVAITGELLQELAELWNGTSRAWSSESKCLSGSLSSLYDSIPPHVLVETTLISSTKQPSTYFPLFLFLSALPAWDVNVNLNYELL